MINQSDIDCDSLNSARDELIVSHLQFAKQITQKIAFQLPSHLDRDDLMSAAVIGLVMAAERFDPTRGIQFKTYAEHRIRGTILDELRNQDWLSRSLRDRFKLLEREFTSLEQQLGRDPTSEEVAQAMGISLDDYFQLLDDVHYLSVISLDDNWEDEDGSPFGLLDVLENETAADPHEEVHVQQTSIFVSRAIDELPDKEREIISRYYYEDLSLKDIGERLKLHESTVCQLHGQAILRLRVKLRHLH